MISIADQVFDELERDILSGVYERDEILTEIKLSEQLGVSRTPIREALRRLAEQLEAQRLGQVTETRRDGGLTDRKEGDA